METVVLPAQDHLAQERYRHQSRVMSGMIYPLGGLPRTRRKVRSPQQVFVAASLHSEIAKVSSDKANVHVADSARSGLVSQMDMSMGVLRSAPSSAAFTSRLPPLSSVLKAPQYRLNNTTVPYGFISHESSSEKQQQQQELAASLATATPVLNGPPTGWRQILHARSDGELLQQGLKKGVEGEKPSSERRKALEKGSESAKGSADRKVVEKNFEKNVEKFPERRKGLERRTMEKKAAGGASSSQGEKSSNVQKKAGVITILQRPQTKQAAAENMALFTGRSIEGVTKQILKSAQVVSQPLGKKSTVEGTAAAGDTLKDAEVSSKDGGGETENVPSSRGSRNVSPKRERVAKKKPSRDFSGKVAARMTDVVHVESRRTQDAEFYGESRRVKTTASRPAEVAPVDRPRSNDAEFHAHPRKLAAESYDSIVAELDSYLAVLENQEPKSIDKEAALSEIEVEVILSPVSSTRLDPIVSNINDRAPTLPGGLHRGSSDSLVGEIGQIMYDARHGGLISRSGSFRDVSRGNDMEVFFLPSSPPKNSERWAGPAYTNSPPPSTLPFPTFPLQRVKSVMTEMTLTKAFGGPQRDMNSETVPSSSAPPSPTHMDTLFFAAATSMQQSPFVDPSSATKDLRRMLNLDVEGGERPAEWTEAEESATQSLKRMLQLG